MSESTDIVYEALGRYIDSLCGSTYIGTARRMVVLYRGAEIHHLTPLKEPLPFLNLFYHKDTVEIVGVWREEKSEAFFLKAAARMLDFSKMKER